MISSGVARSVATILLLLQRCLVRCVAKCFIGGQLERQYRQREGGPRTQPFSPIRLCRQVTRLIMRSERGKLEIVIENNSGRSRVIKKKKLI